MDQKDVSSPRSPFSSMFEKFRCELDEHHDRRERVIKASRDITALSKKIIFALQRTQSLGDHIASAVAKSIRPMYDNIAVLYKVITPELQGINAYRYARNITGGIQEYLEAVLFQHYLESQQLLTYAEARDQLHAISRTESYSISLVLEDYVLGIFDMSGELMRFAISTMASTGEVPMSHFNSTLLESQDMQQNQASSPRNVLHDLQHLRSHLEVLDAGSDWHFKKDVASKLKVTQASVEKVEKALYGLVVRGSERPKGWIPLPESWPSEVEIY